MQRTPIKVVMSTYTKPAKQMPEDIQVWAQYARKLSLIWNSGYYN